MNTFTTESKKDLRAFCLLMACFLAASWWAFSSHWPGETEKSVTVFLSPTECKGDPHGVYRWQTKIDPEKPPAKGMIEVTPAGMGLWKDLQGIHKDSPRQDQEQKWYALTGKVVLVKIEDDGDIHIQLAGRYGEGVQVVVEIPLGQPWSKLREEVFSWADVKFPCKPHQLKLKKFPVITVTGHAFWDGEHHGETENRRNYAENVTVWELHPIAKLEIIEDK